VMIWSLSLLVAATVIMAISAPYFMPIIATGFNSQKLTFTLKLFYVISPVVVIYGVNTIWGAVLNASEQFALVAVTPVITPFVIILFLLLGKSWGISALALGTVCGIIIETTLLGIVLNRQGISLWPKWHGMDPHLREVAGQYLPMITGAFLLGSTGPINQGMAASLGPGSVAALNYGNKAIGFPLNLAAAALGTAVIPYFSIMVVNRNWGGIHHTLKKFSRLIFAVTIPLTILLVVMSEPIVRILFQRGSFTVQDTNLVGRIQALFAIQMPFYISGILIVRLISAFKANNLLMWGAVISIVINIVMNYVFIKWMGVSGIALSTSIVYFVSFCYLSHMLKRLMKKAATELL